MARRNGHPSLCFSERETVLRCQSIFVDKPDFTDDELTFLGFCHINEFLDIASRFAIRVHKKWAVDWVSAILDRLYT